MPLGNNRHRPLLSGTLKTESVGRRVRAAPAALETQLAADHDVAVFGVGASYLLTCAKQQLHPGRDHSLESLRAVGTTGSPLPASGFQWVQDGVGRPIPVISMSGGTDVVSAFIGGCPLVPIRAPVNSM